MAACPFCKGEMTQVDDCRVNRLVKFKNGQKLPSVKYLGENTKDRCGDCNVKSGGYHHPGCDMERCPKCKGQIISCSCGVK